MAALVLAGIVAGGLAWVGDRELASRVWAVTTAVALLPLLWSVVRDLLARRLGVDVIALAAMAGALLLGEYLAGAVVALMLSGGQALEAYAARRAGRELSALLGRAPRVVQRYEDGALRQRPLEAISPGDRILVRPGEVVPVDGVVTGGVAVLDESALTGEPRPVERSDGEQVRSGVVNAASPFDLRATTTAAASTYAGIVRLVQQAQAEKAPMVRLADRWAVAFLAITAAFAAAAWVASGDPRRALAVLVVATPCPLILATPVAIVAGISRAARHGVLVKGGGALETLARGRVLLLDKTGTITSGMPTLSDVVLFSSLGGDELLRIAASLDLVSPHVLAAALVRAARRRGLELTFPTATEEAQGAGIRGEVAGRAVALGSLEYAAGAAPAPAAALRVRRRASSDGSSPVFVSVDGELAGALLFDDPIRPDAARTLRRLRAGGFQRIVLVTGDHHELAAGAGAAIGADAVLADRSPVDKVEAVRAERRHGVVVMVGDGINDAPALAGADVGVAMGARGATASSEAADVVLVHDRLETLADAARIARRTRRIALQSIWAGMGLSIAGMGLAAAGILTPVMGALAQEAIDVAVILNALRALGRGPRGSRGDATDGAVAARVRAEHEQLMPALQRLRQVADRLDAVPPDAALAELQGVRRFLNEELLPHERDEDAAVYPLVARRIGGQDPTATMSRAHLEILHLARRLDRAVGELAPGGPVAEDLPELRRLLYGLHAILRLHFAQEDESFLPLLAETPDAAAASQPASSH